MPFCPTPTMTTPSAATTPLFKRPGCAAGMLLALASLFTVPATRAAELVVRIGGLAAADGQVGCALFATSEGFPTDSGRAQQLWQPARAGGVSCRFDGLAAGRYAVAVSHDLNGNRRVDTNFLGIPTEGWGVSNNVRPALRAPRFEEAAFALAADQALMLDIQVAR